MKQTNDLKKGARVRLRNGWYATMEDNRKGDTRLATVEGIYTEMGSVYAWDIVAVQGESGEWEPVEHTEKQLAARKRVQALFG